MRETAGVRSDIGFFGIVWYARVSRPDCSISADFRERLSVANRTLIGRAASQWGPERMSRLKARA
jgi:hypothetical protein